MLEKENGIKCDPEKNLIVTTGATMNECARMLWLYGAQPVTGLCFAVTMPDRKEKDAPAAGEEAARH